MMWRAWILWSAAVAMMFGLQGCATTQTPEPIVRTVEVAVPVPTPCVSDATPQPPEYPDSDSALIAATPGQRYVLMARGRLMRIQRSLETEPILQSCRVTEGASN